MGAPLARRIVVRIGCLLRGALIFGYVPQVDADASPGGRAAAHAVDEYIVDRKERGALVSVTSGVESISRAVTNVSSWLKDFF